ncbi:Dfp1/Him1, central region-domain-containing protein [Tuber borchii]|uniref:Dfp1/Him1, central region-domain-containing protein n=1 Tax=Tuber borchii TaxID=42251 RepID=A0A2T7A8T8_TUBBO|nr:Dfp1/Him1, central region-domain-containing protein [Tuber borchii]
MSRRAPLTTLPNAVNSPYHSVTAAAAKRQRTQRDLSYAQSAATKDQIAEITARASARASNTESRIAPIRKRALGRSTAGGDPPTFNGVSHAQAQRRGAGRGTEQNNNIDSVRAWQRHYKKVFPEYVFYFENIPEDVAQKCQKQLSHLGARLELFFSNSVTHVVTTRAIPPEGATMAQAGSRSQAATINPSLLDGGVPKADFTFKAPTLSRKFSTSKLSQEDPRGTSRQAYCDILLKAREYRMKIWALEKFQRMMNVMFDVTSTTTTATQGRETSQATHVGAPNVDLTHVLRNERLHGPTDRDPNAAATDLVYFKGHFIYVHDMMGVNRPIMVREYAKVAKRECGNWPQFRSVSGGKCPFIEEAVHQKREKERERQIEKMERTRQKELEMSRGRVTKVNAREELVKKADRNALVEMNNSERRLNRNGVIGKDGLFQVPPIIPAKRTNVHSANEVAFTSAYPDKNRGGEPVASGVQPSNITSAIRSQMISSIADQPGRRAGTSKTMIELNRKVLVGNSKGIPASRRMMDLTNAAANNQNLAGGGVDRRRRPGLDQRAVMREDRSEQERRLKAKAKSSKAATKRECRPGYCENCREKFDDFEEHTFSRRHRKFATNDDNWAELDDLLSELKRPLKSSARRG